MNATTTAVVPPLSVVIPVRNEARGLPPLLADLAAAPRLVRQVLVVDGGSSDATALVARLGGAHVLTSPAGRGEQLRRGLEVCDGRWLLLLHGDVRLPAGWPVLLERAIGGDEGRAWAFHLAIEGRDPALRLVEQAVSLRSRWRGLPYGDQGLLISRSLHDRVGGLRPLPLMEDLEFALRLRRHGRPGLLPAALRVSDRRWRRLGVWQTVLANARLRRDWRRGVAPAELARRYERCGRTDADGSS
jgi:rSAM/selenodomain-associated transferase 2